jgi:DNA-binding IclR family transcriptional regulator
MYPTHKAYTRDCMLPQKGDISAAELAERLGMPFGEALVILNELIQDQRV